jgi:hypothetical protein
MLRQWRPSRESLIYDDLSPATRGRHPLRPALPVSLGRFRSQTLGLELLEVGRLCLGDLSPPGLASALIAAVALPAVVPDADHEPLAAAAANDGIAWATNKLDANDRGAHDSAGPVPLFSPPSAGRLSAEMRHSTGLPALSRGKARGPGVRVRALTFHTAKAPPAYLQETSGWLTLQDFGHAHTPGGLRPSGPP